ncbi:MAG: hypothetical protein KatS3mg068_0197 [Candidatus Sericytochromatia bacterium]|nr:MAG: hypothetical protein KatS3mg068_0197 [Candidatus Sericytochromatia bacterium]
MSNLKNKIFFLSFSLIFSSCTSYESIKLEKISNNNFIDWTKDRIVNTNSFSVKNLKPSIGIDYSFLDNLKVITSSNSIITGALSTVVENNLFTDKLSGNGTAFTEELKVGDKILVEGVNTPFTILQIIDDKTIKVNPTPNVELKDAKAKVYINKNNSAKNFGTTSSTPAIDLNNPGINDDVLYFTTDNKEGNNLFALSSSGNILWSKRLAGNFYKNSLTFSNKTYLSKKVMYLPSLNGTIYCLNTDGNLVAELKVNSSFKNTSVWVDYSNPNYDYIYAGGQNGNFYKLKVDFSSTFPTMTLEYENNISNASFTSSPIMNGNSSIYIGSENGILYDIVPNTGISSRTWNLSLYNKNGSAQIKANPLIVNNNIIVPAGGYLFRILNSSVTQSPLLELQNGLNSRKLPCGKVFTQDYPTGNITSSPIAVGNFIYLANGNALFEIDNTSIESFKGSANYCLSVSGRIDESDRNLVALGNGNVARTFKGASNYIAMVDFNVADNSSPYINYFSIPLNNSVDNLVKYTPVNEFDSKGYPITGNNSNSVSDENGNVYFTFDNGSVSIFETP